MSAFVTFRPPELFTQTNTSGFKAWIKQCLSSGKRYLLIDLENVAFIDSSGLSALVSAHTAVKKHQGELALCNLGQQACMLFQMTSAQSILSIYDSPQDFEHAIRAKGSN